ncbi:MAG: 50S ribosomal protein L23 [uncultured bacterium]|nr:MAG: 50S ribosomal protein L23 [uncultured bacterium]
MRLNNKLIRPIVTEKTLALSKGGNKYTFMVNMKASKGSVSKEIEDTYGVNVIDAQTMVVRGKKRRLSGTPRFRTLGNWKKAIVTLKEGQKIDLFIEGK